MTEEERMTPQRAAERLAQLAPRRDTANWLRWLAHNRNPKRPAAFRVPYTKDAGRIWYSENALKQAAATDRAVQAGHTAKEATLLQAAEGGLLNRPWRDAGRVYGQFDHSKGEPFVKLAIDSPLMTFRLSLHDAATLMVELDNAIHNAESMAEELDPSYQRKLKPRSNGKPS